MMEPDATYAIMTDESNTLDERAVAATDLLVWMAKGGAAPTLASFNPLAILDVIERCHFTIFKALDHLAELEGT
jgi:hypothetical protein